MCLWINIRSRILYNWLIWRVLKMAFFFQKRIFPVFILASGAVRTTPSSCRHIFMRSLIWRWWAFAKKRQIKNHAKLTSYTVFLGQHECIRSSCDRTAINNFRWYLWEACFICAAHKVDVMSRQISIKYRTYTYSGKQWKIITMRRVLTTDIEPYLAKRLINLYPHIN